MKKIIVTLFLLLSLISFSEIREIKMIGLSNSILEGSSEKFKKKDNFFKHKFLSTEVEQINGIREFRPTVLKNIDEEIAIPQNREMIKSLNAKYDRELKNYLENISYNSQEIFFLANQYMMMDNYEKANKIFLLDNSDFKNIFGAATTYRFLAKNEQAVEKYSKAIFMNGSFAESYLGRALANRNLDNYESAVEDLKKYISMTEKEEGYLALADIYFKLEKKKDAYNIVSQGLKKYPNSELLKILGNNIYNN